MTVSKLLHNKKQQKGFTGILVKQVKNMFLDIIQDTATIASQSGSIWDKIWAFIIAEGPVLLKAVIILVVGLIVVKALEKLIKRLLMHSKIDQTAHKLIVQIAGIGMKVIVLLATAGTLGIDTTSLVTLLGAVGLAASLAVKDCLGNLAGGFLVLFSKPFVKGDFIETNSVSGTVENISLLYTTLKTPDNKRIFIPNGEISTAKIVNYSAEETRRLDLVYSIGYNDDIAQAKQVLSEVVGRSGLALSDPAPAYLVAEYGASAINIAVRVWVKTADYGDLSAYINDQVKPAFDKAGITIPYNQLDVHLDPVKAE